MKALVLHSAFLALIGLILSPLAVAHASPFGSEEVTPSEEQVGQAIHNVMLRVGYVERDRVTFASLVPTLDVKLRESEVLKYYEVSIWEETSSVHFYEFPNNFDSWYGWDYVDEDWGYIRNDITDEQIIAYREQFLISKYTDMPQPWIDESSNFLKLAFMDIASYLVNRHPGSEHHLKYNGHGGPGGRLFAGLLQRGHAYEFLAFWSQSLGRPLGVIDMGGPCNKGSFSDLDNFCDSARYYIASDLLNGGYTMDEFTWAKREEVWPLTQYHNLFSVNQNLEEALKGRIDLKRKAYEYSKNNMITNRVAQGNYLYSCSAFRRFSPNFEAFLSGTGVNYHISDDLYQYMIDNNASPTLIEQFNDVFVYKGDNKDFFEWSEVRNGMLMPDPWRAVKVEQAIPQTLTKLSGDNQESPASTQLAAPFVVSVLDQDGSPLAGVDVSFSVTAGEGMLSSTTDASPCTITSSTSSTTATTDANGRARTRLTLGSEVGTNTVSATVEGLEPVTFTAIGEESPLASLFDLFGGGKLVALPDSPQLLQNAPNPFNSQTVLSYFLHAPGPARVEVFALTGQRVAVLHQGPQQAGYHRLRWNGRDDAGRPVASGAYLYRLVTVEGVLTRKLTLLR